LETGDEWSFFVEKWGKRVLPAIAKGIIFWYTGQELERQSYSLDEHQKLEEAGEPPMKRAKTSTFLVEVPLVVTAQQAKHLRAHLEAARCFYNAVLGGGPDPSASHAS
jgi:hypothetical protein